MILLLVILWPCFQSLSLFSSLFSEFKSLLSFFFVLKTHVIKKKKQTIPGELKTKYVQALSQNIHCNKDKSIQHLQITVLLYHLLEPLRTTATQFIQIVLQCNHPVKSLFWTSEKMPLISNLTGGWKKNSFLKHNPYKLLLSLQFSGHDAKS